MYLYMQLNVIWCGEIENSKKWREHNFILFINKNYSLSAMGTPQAAEQEFIC